jgi:MinD-like ATPase involved in chromosome partitioning or flagellar assembly
MSTTAETLDRLSVLGGSEPEDTPDLSPEDEETAVHIERIASGESPAGPRGRSGGPAQVITVLGAPGGSGKSTLAVNLAAVFAAQHPGQTVLADLSLEFPVTNLHTNTRQVISLSDLVEENQNGLSDSQFHGLLSAHESGFRLLPNTVRPGESEGIDPEGLVAVVGRLGQVYDRVVLDCRPSFRDVNLDLWAASDEILVCSPPDVVSISLTRHLLEVLDMLEIGRERVTLVVNHVVPTARVPRSQVERFLNVRTHEIPYGGKELHQAQDLGRVYALDHPRQPTAQAIWQLAEDLAGRASYAGSAAEDSSKAATA